MELTSIFSSPSFLLTGKEFRNVNSVIKLDKEMHRIVATRDTRDNLRKYLGQLKEFRSSPSRPRFVPKFKES